MKEENKVAYARSTWKKVKNFHQGLKELEDKIPMTTVRNYILTGEKNDSIPNEVYEKIEELKLLRSSGIQAEMRYAVAQAKQNGIRLKEKIVKGEDIRPGFSPKVLNKIPSLGIYTHFMWYTEKELEKMYDDAPKNETEKNENEAEKNGNTFEEVEDER